MLLSEKDEKWVKKNGRSQNLAWKEGLHCFVLNLCVTCFCPCYVMFCVQFSRTNTILFRSVGHTAMKVLA